MHIVILVVYVSSHVEKNYYIRGMHGNVDTTSDSLKTASNEIKKHENLGNEARHRVLFCSSSAVLRFHD